MTAPSLADLQTEREALRAQAAEIRYTAALAQTVARADVAAASSALDAAFRTLLAALPEQLAAAIADAGSETEIHRRLSEAAHALLSSWVDAVPEAVADPAGLVEAARRGTRPRDLLTVSQWADRNRVLASGTNAPGPWRTALTPYLAEIMDSLSEHSPVREVTFIKSSGVGGTEVIYNWIGYVMEHLRNKDMLAVVPTLELRKRSFNPRLRKMVHETPRLGEIASTAKRDGANTDEVTEFGPQARLIKSGANSPDSLRSDHLPYVAKDECDAYPWDVGGEGDPDTLIANRQRTYTRAKTYNVSTPTIEQLSRIDRLYERSDRRRYHVPCPHCQAYQVLVWSQLKYTTAPVAEQAGIPEAERKKQVTGARYECEACHKLIDEGHKSAMLAAGRWIAERPQVKRHRGYHLNALYAPIGLGLTWVDVAQKWLDAQDDTAELKTFVNTYLGETWTEQGDHIDDLSLASRCAPIGALPSHFITAGVDVQKNRLEVTCVAWRADGSEEAWLLAHEILDGDTAEPAVWDALAAHLATFNVEVALVDAGYNTTAVHAFCQAHPYAVAGKGVPGMNRPLVEDEKKRRQRMRQRRRRGQPTEPIGVDAAKAMLYARLRLLEPGPRYIHISDGPDFDAEYFAQLAAEKLITKVRGTRPFQEWVQTRPRNEALDCLVYATAAMRLRGQRSPVSDSDAVAAAPLPPQPTQRPRRPGGLIR